MNERVPVSAALGRVTFQEVLAKEHLPNRPHAQVPGYAIRTTDTLQAAPRKPWLPTVVYAREMAIKLLLDQVPPSYELPPNSCIPVDKGRPLPKGADAVLPLYPPKTSAYFSDHPLKIKRPIPRGWFTAEAGVDCLAGAPLLPAGIRLKAEHISLLLQAGVHEVEVVRRPRVAIIYAGSELNSSSQILTLPAQLLLQQLGYPGVPVFHSPIVGAEVDKEVQKQDFDKWLGDFDLLLGLAPPTKHAAPTRLCFRGWEGFKHRTLLIGADLARSPTIGIPFHGPRHPRLSHWEAEYEDHAVWLTIAEYTPDCLLLLEIVLPHLLDAMEHAHYHGRDWQTLPCALPYMRPDDSYDRMQNEQLCWAVVKETQQGERLLFPLEAPWYGSFKPLAEANAIVALPMNKAVIPLGEPLPHMLLSNAALPQVSEEDLARIEAAKAALAAEQARRAELAALPPLPMAQAWAQLEAWLKQEEPALLRSLGKPASPEALAELEAKLKLSLPDDFKAALSVHDGQKGEEPLFEGEFFLSTKGVLSQWRTWTKLMKSPDMAECSGAPDEGIRPDWFHPAWIPFTHDGMGNHLCLDLAPAEGGQVGQIIRVWHDEDERQLIAPSFAVWFSSFVRSLPNEDEAAPGTTDSVS